MGPVWIVNDLGELGVKIDDRFFFLYKGGNIEYGDDEGVGSVALHDDGTSMMYRVVGKREFGETCQPLGLFTLGLFRKRWPDLYQESLVYITGLSDGKQEDGEWKPLPSKKKEKSIVNHEGLVNIP